MDLTLVRLTLTMELVHLVIQFIRLLQCSSHYSHIFFKCNGADDILLLVQSVPSVCLIAHTMVLMCRPSLIHVYLCLLGLFHGKACLLSSFVQGHTLEIFCLPVLSFSYLGSACDAVGCSDRSLCSILFPLNFKFSESFLFGSDHRFLCSNSDMDTITFIHFSLP